jgi:ketosteroid isomerase-like protein
LAEDLPSGRDTRRMMVEENVEAVRRVLETPVRRHFSDAELEQLFHPEVHFDLTVREVNPATYDGYAGVRQFIHDLFEIWDEWSFGKPFELLPDENNRVLAVYTLRGRGRSSGVVVEMPVYNVYTVRSGRVIRLEGYRDRSAALEAVGPMP